MTKKTIRIGFFVSLGLLALVGYISMGGFSKSSIIEQKNTDYLIYGKKVSGSAKEILGKSFNEIDSITTNYKHLGEVAGYFYTNPSKENNYHVEVFMGLLLAEKMQDSITGFAYENFHFNHSVKGEQETFFLFSSLYNDIFSFAKKQNLTLDSIVALERYPSRNKTIIEVPVKVAQFD